MKRQSIIGLIFVTLLLGHFDDLACSQELHVWRSKHGSQQKAAFFQIDLAAKTITILVPKTVPFDSLSPQSVALAKRLAEQEARVANENSELLPQKEPAAGRFPEVRRLDEEMMKLRHDKEFNQIGFLEDKTSRWLKEVTTLRKSEKYQDRPGAYVSLTLEQLGREYQETRGSENKFTRLFRARLDHLYATGDPFNAPLQASEFE